MKTVEIISANNLVGELVSPDSQGNDNAIPTAICNPSTVPAVCALLPGTQHCFLPSSQLLLDVGPPSTLQRNRFPSLFSAV